MTLTAIPIGYSPNTLEEEILHPHKENTLKLTIAKSIRNNIGFIFSILLIFTVFILCLVFYETVQCKLYNKLCEYKYTNSETGVVYSLVCKKCD